MASALDAQNPIDGEPDTVERYSRYYSGIAEAIRETATNLATVISSADTTSDAVDAFVEVATEVRGQLTEVDDRYETVADELARYSSELRTLQGEADAAMAAARHAHGDYDSAAWRLSELRDQIAMADPQDPAIAGLRFALSRAEDQVQYIEQVVAQKNEELRDLIERWRNTADGAAQRIRDSVDGSPLNDSGWDRFVDGFEKFVTELLPLLETILDVLAVLLTVLAVLAVLTGVGAAFAPVLFAAARLAQLASKIIKVVRVVLTVVLVCSGRVSPMALVDIAIDMAVDKIGGKLADSIAGPVLNKVPTGDFDTFAAKFATDMADNVNGPNWGAGLVNAANKTDGLSSGLDMALDVFPGFGQALGVDAALSLTSWYPTSHALNGLSMSGWSIATGSWSIVEGFGGPDAPPTAVSDFTPNDVVAPAFREDPLPTAADLVSAS
ncbi:hypothetical protein LGT39_10105 [Demequina sp. TTPB684]|uniref:hypothetical protein n=1 Tax=unclassified Demequina TaxID=2620311 RepID=UPI001CF58DA6|nr:MULTISPECIES: hypothetical protein [unclassified Demequina]MCB2413195.1 hypothetical protein [Demequina sp. TTPB684]UPU88370.1 hypothetical protein LGT36_000120 [Demequina sp. TMPB413]